MDTFTANNAYIPSLTTDVLRSVFHYLPGRYNKAIISLVCKQWNHSKSLCKPEVATGINPIIEDIIATGRACDSYRREQLEIATFIKTNISNIHDEEKVSDLVDFFISLGVHPLLLGKDAYSQPNYFYMEWYVLRNLPIPEYYKFHLRGCFNNTRALYKDLCPMQLLQYVTDCFHGDLTPEFIDVIRRYKLEDEIFLGRIHETQTVSIYNWDSFKGIASHELVDSIESEGLATGRMTRWINKKYLMELKDCGYILWILTK